MCTVAELITKLQTLPPDLIVQVVEVVTCGYENYGRYVELDLDQYSDNFNEVGKWLELGED